MIGKRLAMGGLGVAALLAATVAAPAQAPAPSVGKVGATTRLAPPTGARRPRGFRECNREAIGRRLRGMERRRFVYRCQLGSGRPLFRRRGPPLPPPAPGEGATPGAR